ncbi:MAG: ribonuclease HI, partial [Novosphingobium sp.]|nr:ribonuclease HI [Novosphingobium sp.]
AVMKGLSALKSPCHVKLHTDSRYVIDGITKWVFGWQKNGWRTADRKPVKNEDLWRELVLITKPHRIDWIWVKGHDGHIENERVDKLASDAAMAVRR